MAAALIGAASSLCRPCASRDPRAGLLDVLRLSAVQQTFGDIVRRDDSRPGEARLGAQGESRAGIYRQVQRRSTGLVRAARLTADGICPRAADQEVEASLENRVDRSEQSALDRSRFVDCPLTQGRERAEQWVPACAGTTKIRSTSSANSHDSESSK